MESEDPDAERQLDESLGESSPNQGEPYGKAKDRLRMSLKEHRKRLGWVNAELLRLQGLHHRPVTTRSRDCSHCTVEISWCQ